MSYVDEVLAQVEARDANEPLFLQTVREVLNSLRPMIEPNEEKYRKLALLERLVEPEKTVIFRVPWVDDNGVAHVNRGYRVQFNSAIGPYKGGLRFAKNVTLDTIKFLAFEQCFKNSLTTLPIGGGKGGSDFDPIGKSDAEVMRFCQSFMTELYRYIGANTDSPAGDMGVGAREIGFLYGQYKRITGNFEAAAVTGKSPEYGGSLGRPTATGFGAVYYAEELIKTLGRDIKGATIAISGFGQVAWGVAMKATQLGAKVVTISGPDGYVYDKDGMNEEKVDFLLTMRATDPMHCKPYADKFGAEFIAGEKPWGKVKADYYMPCAMQNDIRIEDAKRIKEEGTCNVLIEVANMPTTQEAIDYLRENGFVVAPSKAVNAGGVAVSAMEMAQDAAKYYWTEEEVEEKLHAIMKDIFNSSLKAANKFGLDGVNCLIEGANLAAADKIVTSMIAQGIV